MTKIPRTYGATGEDWTDVYLQTLVVGIRPGSTNLGPRDLYTNQQQGPAKYNKKAFKMAFGSFLEHRTLFWRALSKVSNFRLKILASGSSIKYSIFGFVEGRRLAALTNGLFALVPGSCRPGDRVFIAQGGRLPLIIRKRRRGIYELIGDAYVHGIMHGEAWNTENLVTIELE
jgi:hypothetical protein